MESDRFGLFGGVGINGLRVLRPRDLRAAAEKVTFSKERSTSSFERAAGERTSCIVHKEPIDLSGDLGERKSIHRNVDFAPRTEL